MKAKYFGINVNTLLVGGVIIATLVYFKMMKQIMSGVLGIFGKGKQDQNISDELVKPDSPFKPNESYLDSSFTFTEAETYAKMIYDAVGYFTNNTEQIWVALNACNSKADLNYISKVFSDRYTLDMLSYLRGGLWMGLSDKEMNEIIAYVNKLN